MAKVSLFSRIPQLWRGADAALDPEERYHIDLNRALREWYNEWAAIINTGGDGAPVDATYVTLSLNATLTQERVLTAGTGITLVDSGANGTITVSANIVTLGIIMAIHHGYAYP